MSMNLTLDGFDLWQTPTTVTYEALADNARYAKDVYFRWLDGQVERQKPKLHPRASNAERKRVTSTQAWRDYVAEQAVVDEHKKAIEKHLAERPTAKWGET